MTKTPDALLAVRPLIEEAMVTQTLPSVAVAVAGNGAILWEEGFGWADREARLPAGPHTPYSIASITKPLTATALMVLVERGLTTLERPLNADLGRTGVAAHIGDADLATLRRVANHTAGLPLHYHFFPDDNPRRRPAMAETITRYGHLVTAPGERHQYSNLGYGLLEHVIGRLSGMAAADFLRAEVLLPLGMVRSALGEEPALAPHRAARYGPGGARLPLYDFDHPGASAAYASAHDLALFGSFHLHHLFPGQRAILPPAAVDEMQRPTVEIDPAMGTGYGVGWRTRRDGTGLARVGHTGGMDGVSTFLELVPALGLAVAVLVNAPTALPAAVVEAVLDALVPGRADRRAALPPPPAPEQPAGDGLARAGLTGRWEGTVWTAEGDLPLALDFRPDDAVHVRLGTQLETLLTEPRLAGTHLTGRFAGDLGTADADRLPHHLHADLQVRGDVCNGALVSISLPEVPFGNALAHWTDLHRV